MGTGFFPGVKRPGLGVNDGPAFSAEVKEKLELYFYSLTVTSLHVIGRNFTSLYRRSIMVLTILCLHFGNPFFMTSSSLDCVNIATMPSLYNGNTVVPQTEVEADRWTITLQTAPK